MPEVRNLSIPTSGYIFVYQKSKDSLKLIDTLKSYRKI